MNRFLNQKGVTLVEAMVAAAVLAIVTVGVASAVTYEIKQSDDAMMWINISNVVQRTNKIFSTSMLCDQALSDGSGNPINMNLPAQTNIGGIQIKNATSAAGYTYVTLNSPLAPPSTLTASAINISEQSPGFGRSVVSTGTPAYNTVVPAPNSLPKNYTVYTTYVTLQFSRNGALIANSPGQRIPLVIAVNDANHADYRCYQNVFTQQVCEANGGYIDVDGNSQHTMFDQVTKNGTTDYKCSTCAGPSPNCLPCPVNPCANPSFPGVQEWLLSGLDATGTPICSCQWYCQ